MYRIVRTKKEIDELLNALIERINEGGSKWSGMSYEEGAQAAIDWLIDADMAHPYKE